MIKLLVLPLLFFFHISSYCQSNTEVDNDSLTHHLIDTVFDDLKVFPVNTQLSFALIQPNELNFIGLRRTADTLSSLNNKDQIFEIGSVTKVFTATLLSHIVQSQNLALNNPISEYIQIKSDSVANISLKQLANHTSGLPRLPSNLNLNKVNPYNPYKDYDNEKLNSYLTEDFELVNTPGSSYLYSNLGAGLLGYILSQITEMPYEQLLQNYIFSKYKMQNSTTEIHKVKENLVDGLSANGSLTPNWNLNALVAAGGIYSSTNDLSKFVMAQFNDNDHILKMTQNKTFEVNKNLAIGLGWHIVKRPNGDKYLWHNGGTGGYTSSMAINLEENEAIIILSNISAFHPQKSNIDKIVFTLLEKM